MKIKPKFNVRKAIKDFFFEGSFNRVDYAEERLNQIYKLAGIRRKGKIEDLPKYYGITYEMDFVTDRIHGHPEKLVPCIYIPFKEDLLEDNTTEEEEEINDSFLGELIKDLEKKLK